jgi:hypothetical protein
MSCFRLKSIELFLDPWNASVIFEGKLFERLLIPSTPNNKYGTLFTLKEDG